MYENLKTGPLSEDTIREMQETDGSIEGKVDIELSTIINGDFEDFLDNLSEKLTGSACLANIDYELIGFKDTVLTFRVTGDAAYVFDN